MTIRFHEKSDAGSYGLIQTVGYLFSPDAGRTWQRSDGTQVTLPVTAETFDVVVAGGLDYGSALEPGRWQWPLTERRGWSTASGQAAWAPMSSAHLRATGAGAASS